MFTSCPPTAQTCPKINRVFGPEHRDLQLLPWLAVGHWVHISPSSHLAEAAHRSAARGTAVHGVTEVTASLRKVPYQRVRMVVQ